MLNKLKKFISQHCLVQPGDNVICAVSGGADSIALLFALYLLREKLEISLSAVHFNHGLRGEESNRDELFVRQICDCYQIPLTVGSGEVVAGKKGLEAAAREARYAFFRTLSGKIATAHTADDNAETVLMHLVRGTGLRGLGGIMPQNGQIIRPMLSVTRTDVLKFLKEYHLTYVTDSSNNTDDFLRNRIRHYMIPFLRTENPSVAENLSSMALRLRYDEDALSELSKSEKEPSVLKLRTMHRALRFRWIDSFLRDNGVREPESEHIELLEQLIFSQKPSASADFPGGIKIRRNYDLLECCTLPNEIKVCELTVGTEVLLEEQNLLIKCLPAENKECTYDSFTVVPKGKMILRSRRAGDMIRLKGGTKELKKLFIDRKIHANTRCTIPVIADEQGVLGVYGFGANLDRLGSGEGAVRIQFIAKDR